MIVEREQEIKAFVPEESWKMMALVHDKKDELPLELTTLKGKKADLKKESDVIDVMSQLLDSPEKKVKKDKDEKTESLILNRKSDVRFQLKSIEQSEGVKNPGAPFTTSTLQQTASRMFGRGVKQVMSVAQKLYENGLITYMRTDSVALSDQALGALKGRITKEYGDKYYQFRKYAQKSKNAQEAHEAIRPTHADRTPSKSGLSAQELKLYDLIRRRTVASQMKSAQVQHTVYVFQPLDTKDKPIAQDREIKGQLIKFEGFLKVATYQKAEDVILPALKEKVILNSTQIDGYQQFSKPPARYTEATLVKALETRGIGRPSTYAPTISTIQERGYVVKDENKLKPTDIAFVVVQYLEKHFVDLMNYEFTARLETKLDDIAQGDLEWKRMLADFYTGFHKHLQKADETEKELVSTGEKCPQCKQGDLIIRFGKAGKFIACNRYPDCTYTKQSQDVEDKLSAIKAKYEGKPCEAGGTIVVRM
jgi:DNA topoisomerase-1